MSEIRASLRDARINPVLSRETFQELVDTLWYPKFSLTRDEITFLIEDEVLPYFEVVIISEKVRGVCADPDDDMFISCALSAGAGHLVTGDRALLDVRHYKGTRILTPADFIKLL